MGQSMAAETSLGDKTHDKVLAVVRSHDSEAGANKHTDFGHLGSEFFSAWKKYF